jgi:hypothetical protein
LAEAKPAPSIAVISAVKSKSRKKLSSART